jgi:uncharacterized RDD family membrane protein YckC
VVAGPCYPHLPNSLLSLAGHNRHLPERESDYPHPVRSGTGVNLRVVVGESVSNHHLRPIHVIYASFGRRFLAAVIDAAAVAVVLVVIQSVTGVSFLTISRYDPSRIGAAKKLFDSVDGVNLTMNISFTTEGTLALLVLVVGYLSLAESGCKASLGMFVTGIRVVATQGTCIGIGRALWRNCAKVAAYATVIGALLVAFSARRQGLHDYAARTVVVVWKRYLGSKARSLYQLNEPEA